jgi:arginine N-succinyltransferase
VEKNMYVIRPIENKDIETFERMAFNACIGMTNMPRNRKLLEQKIQESLKAFSKHLDSPEDEKYQFVLENIQTGEIGGVSGIFSKTGVAEPEYFYRIENYHPASKTLNLPDEIQILQPVIYKNGPSEICSLFLAPEFRKEGLGRLLSLSRFLFIAAFPTRFEPLMIAEMRGVADKNNNAPFWDGLGRNFLNMDFAGLMTLQEGGKHFIPEILPKYPVYVFLLSKETQDAIGKTHVNTRPALNMLIQEGFNITNEIDLFDAGPKISAHTSEIRTVKSSVLGIVKDVTSNIIESERYILSNESLDFRACFGSIDIHSDNQVSITSDAAKVLRIQAGDKIRFITASAQKENKEKDICQPTIVST